MFQSPKDEPSPGESEQNLTGQYFNRYRTLRSLGCGDDSAPMRELLREIEELPPEKTERLRSLIRLGAAFRRAAVRAHQEMDPRESPERFGERLQDLAGKFYSADKSEK